MQFAGTCTPSAIHPCKKTPAVSPTYGGRSNIALLKHCNVNFLANQSHTLPSPSELASKGVPYIFLEVAECPVCGRLVMRFQGRDDYGGAIGGWQAVKGVNAQARYLDLIQNYGNVTFGRFVQGGADWVYGSNHTYPYNLQRVMVK